jgi:hypothetical protein
MEIGLTSHPPDPGVILALIKDAISTCRNSSSRLCGLARGLEIGTSTLQRVESNPSDSIAALQERSERLSAARDEYSCGVALGINLATGVASNFRGSN